MKRDQSMRTARSSAWDDRLSDNLDDSSMMAHLHAALKKEQDIGEYGRLTFAIVARHFLKESEIVRLLAKQPGLTEETARAMFAQVQQRDYSPPKRDTILEWQKHQDFPICPDPDDPNACNVYRELRFPQEIYDRIGEFWMEKAESRD
jgi:hypothetical protein